MLTRDSDTTFKVKRSKVKLQGRGILWRLAAQLVKSVVTRGVFRSQNGRNSLTAWGPAQSVGGAYRASQIP